jgi:hypothetical protein
MVPVTTPEFVQGAVQVAFYFVTAMAALLSLLLTGRA